MIWLQQGAQHIKLFVSLPGDSAAVGRSKPAAFLEPVYRFGCSRARKPTTFVSPSGELAAARRSNQQLFVSLLGDLSAAGHAKQHLFGEPAWLFGCSGALSEALNTATFF